MELPPLDLSHLRRLTDCTGIIQHAVYSLPDRSTGYTADDNARALVVSLLLKRQGYDVQDLPERYLGFLYYLQSESGEFEHGLDYSRQPLGKTGSEDTWGRVMLACALAASQPGQLAQVARRMWKRALPLARGLRYPRGKALGLLALASYPNESEEREEGRQLAQELGDSLIRDYRRACGPGWFWFEDILTYANALLPHGLLAAYRLTESPAHLKVAQESLEFLCSVVFPDGYLQVVGNRGWFPRQGPRALFDEQPLDAGHLVEACLEAYRLTGQKGYRQAAEKSLAWFHGKNTLGVGLLDPATGGVYDGLGPEGPNLNQGAESLLAYLSARLAWETLNVP